MNIFVKKSERFAFTNFTPLYIVLHIKKASFNLSLKGDMVQFALTPRLCDKLQALTNEVLF